MKSRFCVGVRPRALTPAAVAEAIHGAAPAPRDPMELVCERCGQGAQVLRGKSGGELLCPDCRGEERAAGLKEENAALKARLAALEAKPDEIPVINALWDMENGEWRLCRMNDAAIKMKLSGCELTTVTAYKAERIVRESVARLCDDQHRELESMRSKLSALEKAQSNERIGRKRAHLVAVAKKQRKALSQLQTAHNDALKQLAAERQRAEQAEAERDEWRAKACKAFDDYQNWKSEAQSFNSLAKKYQERAEQAEAERSTLRKDYDELRYFVKYITLRLQTFRSLTPEQFAYDFQEAYRLYVKHDVEDRKALEARP